MGRHLRDRNVAMHVTTTRRRHGDREYTTTLVRQSYREGGKVRHRTLANLSHLPEVVHPGFPGDSVPWISSSLVVWSCAASARSNSSGLRSPR